MALASTRQLRSQGQVSAHAHRTEGVTRPEGRERANVVGVGVEVGIGNRDGNRAGGGKRDVNGDVDGDGAERKRG